jgi:outer membrane lipase/esterase
MPKSFRDAGLRLTGIAIGLACFSDASMAQQAPVIVADTVNTESILSAVRAVCPQLGALGSERTADETQLFFRCNRVLNATGVDANREDPLRALTGEELTAAQSTSIDFGVKQFSAVASRLASFRSAARGTTIAALEPDRTWTLYGDGGGAASGDEELIGTGRLGVFLNGYLGSGDKDETDFEAGYDVDSYGATLGVDYRFTDAFVAGAALGLGKIEADFNNGGDFSSDSLSGSLFASVYGERYYLDGIVTYSTQDHDSSRRINYEVVAPPGPPGAPTTDTIDEIARGSTDGETLGAGLSFGYDFGSGALRFGPILAISYLDVDVDGFTETGSTTGLNLQYADQSAKSLQLQAGVDLGYVVSTGWGVLYPQARVVYVSEQENDQQTFFLRYAADPCTSLPNEPVSGRCNSGATDPTATSFSVTSDAPDDSFVRWGVSLSAVLANGVAMFVDYDAVASLDTVSYGEFTIGIRYEFR